MLSIKDIDMDMLTTALESAEGFDIQWWLDPATGQCEMSGDAVDDAASPDELEERGAIPVDRADPHRGYRDMEDFIATLDDGHVRGVLQHALERSRPFRRFKDALYGFPDVQERWYSFHEARMREHAIEWLVNQGLVDEFEAERELGTDGADG